MSIDQARRTMHVRKLSRRQEHQRKQRERIDASPVLGDKFPELKALLVTLEYFGGAGGAKSGGMKYQVNLKHAPSVLCMACPGPECAEGDFDLTEALANAIKQRSKVVTGELHCAGTRQRGKNERVNCEILLRYRLNLKYQI